jgi:3,4-dihydroxy 2-butanone 4-phosphate synthase/GTP cyclohydrolase II
LRLLGIRQLRLITNNHAKRVGLKGYGLEIVEEIALPIETEPLLEV